MKINLVRPVLGWVLWWATSVVHADNLLQIYEKAQGRDPIFEAARYSLQATEQKVPQARANWLPTVSLSSNTGKQTGNVSFDAQTPVDRDVRSWANTLQLTQPIYRPANGPSSTQAEAQLRQAQAQFVQAQQDLILRVAQSYLDVLVAVDAAAAAHAQVKASQEQLQIAQQSLKQGAVPVTDMHEAKARFDLVQAQQIAANNDVQNKKSELERITGDMPADLVPLRSNIELAQPQPFDLQAWLVGAREQHPLVQINQAAQEVAEREIEKSRSAHLPSLDLTASRGSNFASGTLTSQADVSTLSRSRQIGLQLSIPLFAGGGVTARVREAAANAGKASAELEGARRQASALARQAFYGVVSGQSQVQALRSAVLSSTHLVQSHQMSYAMGARIQLDVLNAQQQLASVQRDLTRACADTLMHGLRLKASTGTLALEDMQALNALLQVSVVPASPVLAPAAQTAASAAVKPVVSSTVAPVVALVAAQPEPASVPVPAPVQEELPVPAVPVAQAAGEPAVATGVVPSAASPAVPEEPVAPAFATETTVTSPIVFESDSASELSAKSAEDPLAANAAMSDVEPVSAPALVPVQEELSVPTVPAAQAAGEPAAATVVVPSATSQAISEESVAPVFVTETTVTSPITFESDSASELPAKSVEDSLDANTAMPDVEPVSAPVQEELPVPAVPTTAAI